MSEKGWEEMTVFMRSQWNPNNKCEGQYNSTSLLVQEYFGGDIISYPNPNGGVEKKGHWFNRINGVDIDLTSDQFNSRLTDYDKYNKIANFVCYKFSFERAAYILKKNLGVA